MIYITLSILCSIAILLVFRMFRQFEVVTRQGIMINYSVAGAFGVLLFQPGFDWFNSPWILPAVLLGMLFYLVFRLMARVTQENGLSVSSIATKMSVVIPVSVGVLMLSESMSLLKMSGLLLGLLSIVLTSGFELKGNAWLWPLLLFVGSGFIDACIKMLQHFMVPDDQFSAFTTCVFSCAFLTALGHHAALGMNKVPLKTVFWGAMLGVVNFGSLYFLLKSLALPAWESSVIFPINNFGIIAGSTAIAILFFQEKVETRGWIGLGAAVLSIVLLYITI